MKTLIKHRGAGTLPEEMAPTALPEPMYVFLCTGEVITVPEVEAIELESSVLKLLCPDCREVVFPRDGVYMCSRIKDLMPNPD